MSAADFIPAKGWFEQLGDIGVLIYYSQFDKDHYQDTLFAELAVPWSDKLERAVDKRKAEFLAGRWCAKNALTHIGHPNFAVVADKNRCPLWPMGVKGAITHSNNMAMVALTQREDVLGIGIDIENVMSDKTLESVKDAIVQGSENDFLTSLCVSANVATSMIFSIKESFFKAAYPSTGYYFDFDAVTITELDLDNRRFTLKVNQDLNPKIQPGRVYSGQVDFVAEQVLSLLLIA